MTNGTNGKTGVVAGRQVRGLATVAGMPRYYNVNSSGVLHSKHAQAASPPCRRATLAGRTVGETRHPKFIRPLSLELPVDPVQRARRARIGSRRANPLAANRATQTLQFHQSRNRTACHRNTFPIHLLPDLRHAIDLHVGLPDALDLGLQNLIAFGAGAAFGRIAKLRSMASVARRGNPQDLADRLDPEGVAMLIDEGPQDLKRRSSSAWAKNALATLRISLARRNSLTSRSKALSRSRSSVVTPWRSP